MNYFYLYIFILSIFIISISYLNTYRETFNSRIQHFILLGDSIFKNDLYVSDGKSINDLLLERTNGNTTCLAKDDTKIVNVYNQILNIPDELNNKYTTIFLSVGGNDILSQIENNSLSSDTLKTIFIAYKKLIESIQMKSLNANLVLCDIYYPDNLKYKQYKGNIETWNQMIYDYSREEKNNIKSVLKLSSILTKPEDFTFDIEPSSIGSQKMVDAILSSY